MPANLPPTYYAAEERFRQATSNDEKIRILEEMLSIMPKHKGTDHLQADLRAKISRLKKEGEKKKIVAKFNPYAVEKEDCPQVFFVGPPNCGKSSLLNTLTGAINEVAEYPYTTVKPGPGIFRADNYRFQLVDLPPIMNDDMEGWMRDLLRQSDGIVLVFDVSTDKTLDQVVNVMTAIDKANIFIGGADGESPPIGTVKKKAMAAFHKRDIANRDILELMKTELGGRYRYIETSSVTGVDKNLFAQILAEMTEYIRVFTKIPGKKADMQEPYMVQRGITVQEMAANIHRDIGDSFKYGRVWGVNTYDGQRVGKDHVLTDGDIVEVHTD